MGTKQRRWALVAGSIISVVSLTLTGCAAQSGGEPAGPSADQISVGFGASKEDFQEALAGMDPVTLVAQPMSSSPESWSSESYVNYADRINEWSGGKITIELNYAWPIAPVPEVHSASSDGRLDWADFLPLYQPSEFPLLGGVFQEVRTQIPTSPVVGQLVEAAVFHELGWTTEAALAELGDDVVALSVAELAQGPHVLACSDKLSTLADFKGKQIAASGQIPNAQVEALGAVPVSLTFGEYFEALQRGVVDCVLTSFTTLISQGVLEAAPHLILPSEGRFASGPQSLVFNKDKWEGLPLAAQQLLFDQVVPFTAERAASMIDVVATENLEALEDVGGELSYLDESANEALTDYNTSLRDGWASNPALGDDFEERVDESIEKWTTAVENAGYTDEGDWRDFLTWHDGTDIAEFEKLLLPLWESRRPS